MNHPAAILPDWKWGTAEGSRQLDRLLDSRLTFREKLEWLEEAETLTLQLRAGRMQKLKTEMVKSGNKKVEIKNSGRKPGN
jgi:hypothetical protein